MDCPEEGSLLTTTAAPLSAEAAARLALERFGVRGQAKPLTSERDQNFLLRADGADYVLKIANPAEDEAVADFQSAALDHIAAADPGLSTPRVVRALDGGPAVLLGERVVRLLTFLPGTMLHQARPSEALRRDIGRMHARLGLALRGFDHPAAGRELMWDLMQAGKVVGLLEHVDPARRALAARALEGFAALELAGLRTQVIHNDLNPHNVVVDPHDQTRCAGILDFGDMVRAPLVCDVAVAAAYQFAGGDDPFGGAGTYVGAYHSVCPLTADEVAMLPALIATRMAMTVTITEWRAARYPENRTYILRNHPSAVAGLEVLAGLGERAVERLVQACQAEGGPCR